jgi:hypothetical protein
MRVKEDQDSREMHSGDQINNLLYEGEKMNSTKTIFFRPVWLLALAAAVFFAAPAQSQAFEITIDVSPNVLNIQSVGLCVTVHTDIGYSRVDPTKVYLNGVLINGYFADDRGYFVAKFDMNEIKSKPLNIDVYNAFTMEGATKLGEPFSGTQNIKVIDRIPSGGQ